MIYNFCPFCGSKYQTKSENFAKCINCTKTVYENSKPCSSAVILNDKQEVLLGFRSINPQKNTWDLPGGFLENGEDPTDGLRREIREELNVEMKIGNLYFICTDNYLFEGNLIKTLNLFYLCIITSGKIKPLDDISKIGWFPLDKLPEKLAFNNTRLALRELVKIHS